MKLQHPQLTQRDELTRRGLLRAGLLGWGGFALLGGSARGLVRLSLSDPLPGLGDERTLLLIQLAGGNDGLSLLVPHGDDRYHAARPALRIPATEVLALDAARGLHPRLGRLRALYESGGLAIVEGVGYPKPNRSHFASFEIWHTADARGRAAGEGWIGRVIDARHGDQADPNRVVHIGRELPHSLVSTRHPAACFALPETYRRVGDAPEVEVQSELVCEHETPPVEPNAALAYLRRVERDARASSAHVRAAADAYRARAEYPRDAFASALRTAAALIQGGLRSSVISLELGGFDTHENQRTRYDAQMRRLDAGLGAFFDDLQGTPAQARVLVALFSEFGRRVAQNASGGTDHGTAGPMLLAGAAVRGGLHGAPPDLGALEGADLVHTTDFRSVYAALAEHWFEVPQERVFGRRWPIAPVLRPA